MIKLISAAAAALLLSVNLSAANSNANSNATDKTDTGGTSQGGGGLAQDLEDISAQVDANTSAIQDNSAAIDGLRLTTDALSANLAGLTGTLSLLSDVVATNSSEIYGLQGNMADLQGDLDALATSVDANSSVLQDQAGQIAANAEAIALANVALTEQASSIAQQTSFLVQVRTDLEDFQAQTEMRLLKEIEQIRTDYTSAIDGASSELQATIEAEMNTAIAAAIEAAKSAVLEDQAYLSLVAGLASAQSTITRLTHDLDSEAEARKLAITALNISLSELVQVVEANAQAQIAELTLARNEILAQAAAYTDAGIATASLQIAQLNSQILDTQNELQAFIFAYNQHTHQGLVGLEKQRWVWTGNYRAVDRFTYETHKFFKWYASNANGNFVISGYSLKAGFFASSRTADTNCASGYNYLDGIAGYVFTECVADWVPIGSEYDAVNGSLEEPQALAILDFWSARCDDLQTEDNQVNFAGNIFSNTTYWGDQSIPGGVKAIGTCTEYVKVFGWEDYTEWVDDPLRVTTTPSLLFP